MRTIIGLNEDWHFTGPDRREYPVTLPHTWNGYDGQDGGDDYWRGKCVYRKDFPQVRYDEGAERVYLEFQGVNASAEVELNGRPVIVHHGGYAAFRVDVTGCLGVENHLVVRVDNSVNRMVDPRRRTSPSTAASTGTCACWW